MASRRGIFDKPDWRRPALALLVATLACLLLIVVACGRDRHSTGPADPSQPTYHGQVAEVLAANCTTCHAEGGIAPAISRAVKDGIMPPWPPGPESPPFQG